MSCFRGMFIPVVGLDNCEPHDLELDISTPAYEAQIADWTSGAGLSQRGTTANCMIAGVQAEIGMRTKDMIHVPCWENGAPLTVPEYTMMASWRFRITESIDKYTLDPRLDLTGKTAIVTGSSSAKSRTRAEEVAKKIQSLGPKASVCEASVANIKDIPKLVQSALELSETGKIEIIIHK
ncbi:hypothetical protein AUP68_16010 [Ilyonectria robusta]